MANTYQSSFTGAQMDERFTAVATLQSAVTALETAVAAKYAKPANGIPSTDLDADVQAALAKALTAVQSLADYYTKTQVDALCAAIASSVNATSGVTAATLPTASASTAGKIYYIGPTNGEYERYVTAYDGTTYSWLSLGTTAIDLTQYATAAQLSQLEQETIDNTAYSFVLGTISAAGAESDSTTRCRSGYMPLDRTYTIKSDSTHDISLRYYNAKRQFLATSGSWVKELSLSAVSSTYAMFRIVARNSSDAAIEDVASFSSYVTIDKNVRETIGDDLPMLQTLESLSVKKIAYDLVNGYVIDARTDNANFGKALTQSTWGASQFVELQGAKYIRLYRNVVTTASTPSYSGVIFFDKTMSPMVEGVSRVIYGNGGTAFADWTIHAVPEGAVWMRVSVTPAVATTYTYGIELYAIGTDNVAGMQDKGYSRSYMGEKVDLSSNAYEWRAVKSVAGGSQSAAIYGKYVVIINDSFKKLVLFDMEKMATLATCETGFPTSDILHCNQSQFGTLRYADDDMFPLLYTSAQNNEQGRCAWLAYRIIPTLTNGEVSAFTVSLVQTIYLPVMTDSNALGNANIAFDAYNNCVWAYSRNNNSEAANYLKAKFTKFAIPAIYNGTTLVPEVTLSDADILDSFDADWSMAYAQGGFINRGRLYIAQGGPSYGFTCLRGIDLYAQREQVTYFDLMNDGVNEEPEGLFVYDGRIWFHTNSGVLYRIDA